MDVLFFSQIISAVVIGNLLAAALLLYLFALFRGDKDGLGFEDIPISLRIFGVIVPIVAAIPVLLL